MQYGVHFDPPRDHERGRKARAGLCTRGLNAREEGTIRTALKPALGLGGDRSGTTSVEIVAPQRDGYGDDT